MVEKKRGLDFFFFFFFFWGGGGGSEKNMWHVSIFLSSLSSSMLYIPHLDIPLDIPLWPFFMYFIALNFSNKMTVSFSGK